MSSAAVSPESAPLSEVQRLAYTFTSPSLTMRDLRRNASWWVPWVLLSLFSLAFGFTLDKKITWEQAVQTQIEQNPKAMAKLEKLPPEQLERIEQMQAKSARYVSYGSPVVLLIVLAIIAAVLMGIFNFAFGTKISFRQWMAISAYGFLPTLVSTILAIITMMFVQPENFDVNTPVATNPGYFIPRSSAFLHGVMSAFDIIILWSCFLMAIGVAENSKVKRGTAFFTIFGAYFIVKVIGAFASM